MLILHDKVIDKDLQYKDYVDNMVRPHCGHCGLIKAFKVYYTHCITNLDSTFDNESDWRAITSMEFDQFHIPQFLLIGKQQSHIAVKILFINSRKLSNKIPVPSLNLKKTSNGISGKTLLGLKHRRKMYQRSLTQVTNPLPNKRLSSSKRSRNTCLLYLRRP